MSFSAGVFSINSAGQPVVTGTVISSTAFNALTADLATGLSTAILKDGTQTLTANIPMSSFKLTGLAAGSSAGDSLRYEQLFTSGLVTLLGTLKAPTTVGVGAATPAASGSGVSFPATQSASTDANTLDDYEEGTWVPVLTMETPGDLNVVYSVQVGTYTKIGRRVTASCTITTSTFTHTTSSGNCHVTGLPFTALTSANHAWEGACTWSGVTKANYTQFNAVVASNAALVTFDAMGSAQSAANLGSGDMPTGGTVVLHFVLTYETA